MFYEACQVDKQDETPPNVLKSQLMKMDIELVFVNFQSQACSSESCSIKKPNFQFILFVLLWDIFTAQTCLKTDRYHSYYYNRFLILASSEKYFSTSANAAL